FLERPAEIDYSLLMERTGKALELNPKQAEVLKPGGAMVLAAGGDLIVGLNIDAPYPTPLDHPAVFVYLLPDAKKDLERHKAHLIVFCSWPKFSRLDAHMCHLALVRELVEQLPVIGVLWGSALVPASIFKGEFAGAQNGGIPFSLWVLIQYSKQPNG